MAEQLDPEDAKLVILARGARGRVGAANGAAVRDETGRTYASANVDLSALRLSGLQLAVAQAVAAGARGAEAAVVVSADGEVDTAGLAVLAEVAGPQVPVLACTPDGAVVRRLQSGPVE